MSAILWLLGAGTAGVFVWFAGYWAGRRRECGLWEDWYEQEQVAAEEAAKLVARPAARRGVSLTRVQFRRN